MFLSFPSIFESFVTMIHQLCDDVWELFAVVWELCDDVWEVFAVVWEICDDVWDLFAYDLIHGCMKESHLPRIHPPITLTMSAPQLKLRKKTKTSVDLTGGSPKHDTETQTTTKTTIPTCAIEKQLAELIRLQRESLKCLQLIQTRAPPQQSKKKRGSDNPVCILLL